MDQVKKLTVQLDPAVGRILEKYSRRLGTTEEQLASSLLSEYIERMMLVALGIAMCQVWEEMGNE